MKIIVLNVNGTELNVVITYDEHDGRVYVLVFDNDKIIGDVLFGSTRGTISDYINKLLGIEYSFDICGVFKIETKPVDSKYVKKDMLLRWNDYCKGISQSLSMEETYLLEFTKYSKILEVFPMLEKTFK